MSNLESTPLINTIFADEMLMHIFRQLEDVGDLGNVMKVCKRWLGIVKDESKIWEAVHKNQYSVRTWRGKTEEWISYVKKVHVASREFWEGKSKESINNQENFAMSLYKQGYLNEALFCYSRPPLDTHPQCIGSRTNIFLKLEEFEEAHQALDCFKGEQMDASLIRIRAAIFFEEKNWAAAKQEYEKDELKDDIDGLLGRLRLYQELQDQTKFDATQDILYEKLGEHENPLARAEYEFLIDEYEVVGYAKKAFDGPRGDHAYFLAALSIFEYFSRLNYMGSGFSLQNREVVRFRKHSEKSLEKDPNNIKVREFYVRALYDVVNKLKLYSEDYHVEQMIEKVISDIRDQCQHILSLNSRISRIHFFLGKAFVELKDYDEAEKSLRASYRLGDRSQELFELLGRMYSRPESPYPYSEREVFYKEGLTLFANSSILEFNLCQLWLSLKNYQDVIRICKKSEDKDLILLCAHAYQKKGDMSHAQTYYQKALSQCEETYRCVVTGLLTRKTSDLIEKNASHCVYLHIQRRKRYVEMLLQIDLGLIDCYLKQDKQEMAIEHALHVAGFYHREFYIDLEDNSLNLTYRKISDVRQLLEFAKLYFYQRDSVLSELPSSSTKGGPKGYKKRRLELEKPCQLELEACQPAIKLDERNPAPYVYLGDYYSDKDKEKALSYYLKALELNDDDIYGMLGFSKLVLEKEAFPQ